jgi:hypothetical protein
VSLDYYMKYTGWNDAYVEMRFDVHELEPQ